MIAPIRILVVDDETQIASLLAGVLRDEGHEAEFRTDGPSALKRLQERAFDLLVTDLRMPGMDGLGLIEAARRIHPDLDVLIITAYASADTAVHALRHGVSDYLSKPFGIQEIRDAVSKALTSRLERRRRQRQVKDLSKRVEATTLDLQQRVADLSFLHDLTRTVADRGQPLRSCLQLVALHLRAPTVLLTDGAELVEGCGEEGGQDLLDLAQRAGRRRRPEITDLRSRSAMAVPVLGGAVAVARPDPFCDAELELLATAGRDLALGVENDRLRAERRNSYVGIVATLIEAVEAKDRFNRGHSRRVAELAVSFARRLGLPSREMELLETAAKLHDIGKIGIPEEILNKPGRLTDEEFKVIQAHPVIGEQILMPLDFLAEARPIVRHHHERWDGGGYPDGLCSEAIPRPAALLSIVDSYDAMTSNRPYRDGLPVSQARSILSRGAGSQWDPDLVERFVAL